MYVHAPSACMVPAVQRRASDPLELKFKTVVSFLWVLRTEP